MKNALKMQAVFFFAPAHRAAIRRRGTLLFSLCRIAVENHVLNFFRKRFKWHAQIKSVRVAGEFDGALHETGICAGAKRALK